jgi:peptide-methionine (S)-S-oxide reductase
VTPGFEQAVAAIDAGDVPALERLLSERPALLRERAQRPEPYFRRPYLLWFVAENPVRNERLPANIADVARALVDAVRRDAADSLRAQIDYALALVCSGRVPRESGVQTALIDVLADAGADCTAALGPALAHRERAAVMRLLERGAALTLPAAASLGRIEDVSRLARGAGRAERQAALIVAALDGRAEVVPELLRHGADVDGYGPDGFHPHATALHQAVYTGSLETVRALVDAGASLEQKDAVHDRTPLGWAVHMERDEIAAYLRTPRDGRRHVLDPRRLAPLFVRPSAFFRDRTALAAGPPAMAAAYLAAVAEVIGTISTRTDPAGAARQAGRLAGGGPETWLGSSRCVVAARRPGSCCCRSRSAC